MDWSANVFESAGGAGVKYLRMGEISKVTKPELLDLLLSGCARPEKRQKQG
jgi:hypothetical protein